MDEQALFDKIESAITISFFAGSLPHENNSVDMLTT